ncbi:MAG: HAD-IIIA family hydrolase [Ignavibacteria bacterium]|nr:HAD-IIIA family hydrolase [Ignavibacteria bacterium]
MKSFDNVNFSKISFILMDLDGVLTDGSVIYSSSGEMLKAFNAHDGFGINRGRQLGLKFAIISGMSAAANEMRTKRLKIEELYQDCADKCVAANEIKKKYNLTDKNLCFMGDDVFDIPLLQQVAFSACPPEAVEEVRNEVHYITKVSAGRGCAREMIDFILRKQGKI